MSLVDNIRRELRGEGEATLANPPKWLSNWFAGLDLPSGAGISVSPETAVRLIAVFACVKVISESVAMLPLPLYRRKTVGKEKAATHPLYGILHDQANEEITSFQFRQLMMVNALLFPQAYAEIEYNNAGQVRGLWPIPSNKVFPRRDAATKKREYVVMGSSGPITVPDDHMFVLPGIGFDADNPFSPIWLAREAIGLGLATEAMGAKFFANGANASGIAEYPAGLSDEAYARFKTSFTENFTGLGNAQRVLFLEEGAKFHQLTIPPEAAQFLETRKFQVREIARAYNVPPHKIMDLEQATFSNIEHQSLEYVNGCLMAWLVKWEQEIRKSLLLTPAEKKKFFAKFTVDALLRGDFKTRMEGYHMMIQDGVYNADEVRELEDMNPQPNGQGAIYYHNGTMVQKGAAAQPATPANTKGGNANAPADDSAQDDGTPDDNGAGGDTGD